MKKDLSSREDVSLLVRKFYEKVRASEEIGFFFNDHIQDWEEHLEKLTDFWESNLFMVSKYSGNPQKAHIEVDKISGNLINEKHFGEWLNLWLQTINEHFEGDRAERAKMNARKMATHIHVKIFQARQLN